MSASVYEQPLQPLLSRKAVEVYDEHGELIAGGPRIYPELAPAGLWTTPSDLAKWVIEIQRALSGDSKRILSRSMAQQMLAPGFESWGLGPQVGGGPEHHYFTHSGVGVGSRAYLLAYNHGDGIVVMTNGTNPWTNRSFVGPPNQRPIDGTSRREKQPQPTPAISAWENEGGRTARALP
jgi:CubicO group peptidase (beta-lactamase class C family)